MTTTPTKTTVTLTIDGRQIDASPEQTILQVALEAGIYIPYLCYYPGMKPYGACRTCVVTVRQGKRESVLASCTVPVTEGMVVTSQDKKARELRRDVIELLMTEHPHGCLTCHRIELCGPQDICQRHVAVTDRCTICPKNERCELKDTVRSVELDLKTPLEYYRRNLPIHTDDPFYDRDYNLCIVCARCVRVCEEVRFDSALTMTNRSGVALVGTARGVSLLESGCEFCGACIDVCPTGALVERDHKWEKAAKEVPTLCTNCPVGCKMVAEVNRFDKVVRFRGDLSGPANIGQACFKGKFGYDYPNHKQRIKYALQGRGDARQRVALQTAYATTATKLVEFSGDQIALIGSARGTNEDAYLTSKFALKALNTANVDSSLNFTPEVSSVLRHRLGSGAATNSIWEIEKAAAIVVFAGNPTEEQNVLAVPVKRAVRNGAALFVVDVRETELTRYATEWLRPKPGCEPLVVAALIKVVLDEGLSDKNRLSENVDDSSPLRNSILDFDIGKTSKFCGINEAALRRVARAIGSHKTAFLVGGDTLAPKQRTGLANTALDLALLTNNLRGGGTGIYPLYSGANTLGATDMGCAPAENGLGVAAMFEGMRDGKIKAALIMGDGFNPEHSALGDLQAALAKLEFLAVATPFEDELSLNADVILPAATYAELDGTLTNLEGRVQKLAPLWKPKHDERSGWQTLAGIALSMGKPGFEFENTAAVSKEAFLKAGYDPDGNYAGWTDDRKHPLIALSVEALTPDEPDSDKIIFAPGRVLYRNTPPTIKKHDGRNLVDDIKDVHIHAQDAAQAKIGAGTQIVLSNGVGNVVKGRAVLDSPHSGLAWSTSLFGELAIAVESSKLPDPASRVQGLLYTTVTIKPANGAVGGAPTARKNHDGTTRSDKSALQIKSVKSTKASKRKRTTSHR